MADNNEIKTTLTVETDTASVNKARGAFQALGDDLDALAKAQDEYAKKAQQVANEANQASEKIASSG
ncbi:hypothetical protein KQE47_26420, partial [Raoultella planticola]|uniref:hypothetical protein n=1 Tax=Raoultella planticola TaxID=575 RepID=UPI0024812D1B